MRRGPWLIVLDVVLIGAVVLGITGFAQSDRHVTVTVDGVSQEVRTFGDDVAAVLDDAGIVVSERDSVSPELDAAAVDGGTVTVAHARQLSVVIDGKPMQIWTTASTVDEATDHLGVRAQSAELTVSRADRVPISGLDLGVKLPDRVTLIHDGRRTTLVSTASTVGGVLREAGVPVDKRDIVDAPLGEELRGGAVVTVVRVTVSKKRTGFAIRPRTIRRADSSLYEGTEKVVREGQAGRGVAIYRVVRHDGAVVRRVNLSRKAVSAPVTRIVRYGTKERPYSAPSTSASGLNWAALAQCESGGNPSAVNAAGYYGLYQFSLSTWASVGGSGNPIDASSQEQTYRAQILFSRSGSAPWPVCGSLLYS